MDSWVKLLQSKMDFLVLILKMFPLKSLQIEMKTDVVDRNLETRERDRIDIETGFLDLTKGHQMITLTTTP